jgi:hypothetical protein
MSDTFTICDLDDGDRLEVTPYEDGNIHLMIAKAKASAGPSLILSPGQIERLLEIIHPTPVFRQEPTDYLRGFANGLSAAAQSFAKAI